MTTGKPDGADRDARPVFHNDFSPWWWFSFCDPNRPKGTQFLGVVMAQGRSFDEALLWISVAGLNPGGEVLGVPMAFDAPEEWRDRFIGPDDIDAASAAVNAAAGMPELGSVRGSAAELIEKAG